MVYFEQHVVLAPETQVQVNKLLRILEALNKKLPDLSRSLDSGAALKALESVEKTSESLRQTLANVEPLLRAPHDIANMVVLIGTLLVLVLIFFLVLVAMNLALCYLVWKKCDTGGEGGKCQCGKKVD
jgi:hypothetical protein